MINSGVPDTIVDFWLGHEIGEMSEAYKSVQFESLKQTYLAREKLVSISAGKIDLEEVREELKTEMDQQNKQLQIMVNSLVTEDMDLKNRFQLLERKFPDIEKTVQDLKKAVES